MRIDLHWISAVVLAVAVSYASPVLSQEWSQRMPPDPPWQVSGDVRWWTLSDEITPEQLRSIHGDVELHRQRFLEAVMAGRRRLPGEGRMELLRTFIDGKSHPELFPIWLVFDSFSGDIRLAKHYDPTESLIEFGLQGKTLETIIRFATGYWNERQVRVRDNLQRLEVALEFARLVDERMGPRAFEAAVRAGDTGALAEASGYSVELVEEFFATWRRRPAEEFAIQMLPRLKAILGPISWERFRAYLLEVKAPFLVSITAEVDDETWVRQSRRQPVY